MKYKATLDQSSRAITGILTLLFMGVTAYTIFLIHKENGDLNQFQANIFAVGFFLFFYLVCYLSGTNYYTLDQEKLTIHRPLKSKVITIKKIENVFPANRDTMGRIRKVSGISGLFGYSGKYKNQAYGEMKWYATKNDNYVIIDTEGNKIVLTPDNPGLITQIQNAIEK